MLATKGNIRRGARIHLACIAVPRIDGCRNGPRSIAVADAGDLQVLCQLEVERIVPEGWIDYGRTATAGSAGEYGSHFWLARDGTGAFSANGYRGQYTVMVPERDLVIVRLGTSMPEQKRATLLLLSEIVQCFPRLDSAS